MILFNGFVLIRPVNVVGGCHCFLSMFSCFSGIPTTRDLGK